MAWFAVRRVRDRSCNSRVWGRSALLCSVAVIAIDGSGIGSIQARAETAIWLGNTRRAEDPNNWSTERVPGPGDKAIVGPRQPGDETFRSPVFFESTRFDKLKIEIGGKVLIDDDVTVQTTGSSVLEGRGSVLSGAGAVVSTFVTDKTFKMGGGTVKGVTVQSTEFVMIDGKVDGSARIETTNAIQRAGTFNGTLTADTQSLSSTGGRRTVFGGQSDVQDFRMAGGVVAKSGSINADTATQSGGTFRGALQAADSYELSGGIVTRNATISADDATISGGTLKGQLYVTDTFTQSGGKVENAGRVGPDPEDAGSNEIVATQTGGSFNGTMDVKSQTLSQGVDTPRSRFGGTSNTEDFTMTGGQVIKSGTINATTAVQSGGVLKGEINAGSYALSGGQVRKSGEVTADDATISGGVFKGKLVVTESFTQTGGRVTADGKGADVTASDATQSGGAFNGQMNVNSYALSGDGSVGKTGEINAVTATQSGGAFNGQMTVNSYTLSGDGTVGKTAVIDTDTATQTGGSMGGRVTADRYALSEGEVLKSGRIDTDTATQTGGSMGGRVTTDSYALSGGEVLKSGRINADTATQTGGSMGGRVTADRYALSEGEVLKSGRIDTDTATQTGGSMGGRVTTDSYALSGGEVLKSGRINADTAFNVEQGVVDGRLTGEGALIKTTGGTLTLTNRNDYGGVTKIDDGVLKIVGGSIAGDVTNNAELVLNGRAEAAIGGELTNRSVTTVLGKQANVGAVTNSRLISLEDGKTNDRFTVGGDFTAEGESGIALDLKTPKLRDNPTADFVRIRGDVLGSGTTVSFNEIRPRSLGKDIAVIRVEGNADGSSFVDDFDNSRGLINYDLVPVAVAGGGTQWVVERTPDATDTSAPSGTLSASLVAISTGFIEASSAFISAPPNPEKDQVTFGLWARTKGGKYDIDAKNSTTVDGGGGSSSAEDTYRSSFYGFQVGADFGRLNVNGTGLNLHAGLTAGDVWVDTKDKGSGNKADTEAPFVGVYAAATANGFFADIQVQKNFYNIELDIPNAGVDGQKLDGDGWSAVGSVGKVIPLSDTWFIEPSAALQYVTIDVDDVKASEGRIKLDDIDSLLGSLRARVGTAFQASEKLILRPSVQASLWHEFLGDSKSSFVPTTGSTGKIRTGRVGTFGQFGVALSGQVVDTGLLGFVRADYRAGKKIDGYALTGGLRYQW